MDPSCVHIHLQNKHPQKCLCIAFRGPKQYNGIGILQLLWLNGFEQFLIYQGGEIPCARSLHGTGISKPIVYVGLCVL